MINKRTKNTLRDLGLRVYKNEMKIEKQADGSEINKDEKDIIDICKKTFGTGSPSPENLHLFNQLLVETAEVIAEPRVEALLNLLADLSTVPAGTTKVYKIPKTTKPKWSYTAKGTGVDLQRISPEKTQKLAIPQSFSYGAYYEITTFQSDPVGAFRDAVDDLVDAKLDLYFEKINELLATSVTNAEIPTANIAVGSNLGLNDFQKVESTMIRLGGNRPIFWGDIALINHFTDQQANENYPLLSSSLKDTLREELIPSRICKTNAFAIYNPYINETNDKVKFDVTKGYMFPSSGKKAFGITEFGTQRQYNELDPETERVKLKVVFEADITLLNGRYLGYIKDDSVVL